MKIIKKREVLNMEFTTLEGVEEQINNALSEKF